MPFSKAFEDHFSNPRHVGSFEKDDADVGTGVVGSPACGDVMKLQIRVGEDGRIVDACFKTFGCGSAIASSSYATEWMIGKTLDEAVGIDNKEIARIMDLPPIKIHCSVLAGDAVRAAIADWRNKHADAGDAEGSHAAAGASIAQAGQN